MIVSKYKKILTILKGKSNLTNLELNVNDKAIKSVSSVELLGVTLDDEVNINLLICNIYRSAAN